ncbi:response regulator transcription factor [Sulfitobacter sp. TBRI5]|uniref:response regulator transcription factor n=1 Tax=Sulfitobacter sp. TBRI5 TaxID=2989732 RepID=UPI003D9B7D2A
MRSDSNTQNPSPKAKTNGKLSKREVAILARLLDGFSNKEIANALGIADTTVKVHVRSIFQKTGAKNRTQAAIWASENLTQH